MMYKVLIRSQASLLAVLLVAVIVSCNENEVQARTTPAVQRKPPFNGSIFGKRSNLATLRGLSEAPPEVLANKMKSSHLLASLKQQQQQQQQLEQRQEAVSALRATVGRCLAPYDTDPVGAEFCDELLAYLAGQAAAANNDGLMGLINQLAA